MFIRRYATSATRARGFLATGGTIFEHEGMRVHRFTSNGTFTVRRGSAEVEVFVLGPGAHGSWFGGNGGRLIQQNLQLSPGSYSVEFSAQPPPGHPGSGFSRFEGLEARQSPHPPGASAHYAAGGVSRVEIWYGGGGAGATAAGGNAVGGASGRGGHGANGVPLNLWGHAIHVGAGGGGGVRARFRHAGTVQHGGDGGLGGGGAGGATAGAASGDGGHATGFGNGGGGAGAGLVGEPNHYEGAPGLGTRGFVVIRYPLELMEGP